MAKAFTLRFPWACRLAKTKQEKVHKDLTGQSFGKLTVIQSLETGSRGGIKWLCKCECGNEIVSRQKGLTSGNNKSCGCLRTESLIARNKSRAKDLTNRKFGKWVVLSLQAHRSKDGCFLWNCRCECGKEQEVKSTSLLRGRSTKCVGCVHKAGLKQFCVNGHDTYVYGRDAYNYCRGCVRDRAYRRNYGITLEEYEKLYKHQDGCCAICGIHLLDYTDPESDDTQGNVDHDHTLSGKCSVRGLLCGGKWVGCNYKLGHADDIGWLIKAVAYLKQPPAKVLYEAPISIQSPKKVRK